MTATTAPALRRAGPDDLATLAELHAAGFAHPWTAPEFAGLLAAPGTAAVLAERDGVAEGFALWRCAGGEAELITISVAASARGKGLGTTLLQAVLDAACRQAGEIYLEVATDNIAAGRLYESAGFSECGRRRAYYRRAGGETADARILKFIFK